MSLGNTAFREIDRKSRASLEPIKYYKRAVEDRIYDFDETVLGFDEEMAMAEATRCLQCPEPQPCTLNCPAGNDLPTALWHISQGEFIEAAMVFAETSPLPEICGRVCPNLCQEGCALGSRNGSISIGKLEEFVADEARRLAELEEVVPQAVPQAGLPFPGHRDELVGSDHAPLGVDPPHQGLGDMV